MKQLLIICMLGMFTTVSLPASHASDLKKGQKIFKKKLRKACRFSGVRFARTHTQDEWEEIWDEGKFPQEAKRICPRLNLKKIKKKWWPYVYEFSHEYAKDGSHVPHC
jgi:hypothetical protein